MLSEWPFPGPQGPLQSNALLTLGGNYQVHWGRMTSSDDMTIKRPWIGIPWIDAWDHVHFERGYDATMYPIAGAFSDSHDWLAEVIERTYQDPWFEARTRGTITNVGGVVPVPYALSNTSDDILNSGTAGYSNWAQGQSFTSQPNYKEVIFPASTTTSGKRLRFREARAVRTASITCGRAGQQTAARRPAEKTTPTARP